MILRKIRFARWTGTRWFVGWPVHFQAMGYGVVSCVVLRPPYVWTLDSTRLAVPSTLLPARAPPRRRSPSATRTNRQQPRRHVTATYVLQVAVAVRVRRAGRPLWFTVRGAACDAQPWGKRAPGSIREKSILVLPVLPPPSYLPLPLPRRARVVASDDSTARTPPDDDALRLPPPPRRA
jgi:hypothetical protein